MPIVITDQTGNEVFRRTLDLNPLGTFNGELKLADEATLGYYNVNAQLSPDFTSSTAFQVAEYRKPEYEMTVNAAQPEYRQGDAITVTAQANYFFGGAVKDANVRWTLFSTDATLITRAKATTASATSPPGNVYKPTALTVSVSRKGLGRRMRRGAS